MCNGRTITVLFAGKTDASDKRDVGLTAAQRSAVAGKATRQDDREGDEITRAVASTVSQFQRGMHVSTNMHTANGKVSPSIDACNPA